MKIPKKLGQQIKSLSSIKEQYCMKNSAFHLGLMLPQEMLAPADSLGLMEEISDS